MQSKEAKADVSLYAHDELNRLTNEKVDAGGGSYLLEKSYTYDKAGHLLTDTTGAGTISYSYNDVYDLTGVTDRQGSTYAFTYDADHNQLSATDNSGGLNVSFTYNPRGLLASSTDAFGVSENYTYDAAGKVTGRTDSVEGSTFVTGYTYTARNQIASVDQDGSTAIFTYDAAGNLETKSYPNGDETTYAYDQDNRITGMGVTKDGNDLLGFSQAFDQNGNITASSQIGAISTNYSYDALNRLTQEDNSQFGATSYSYDHSGNRLTMDNPYGHTDYSYNQANQLTTSTLFDGETSTTTGYNYDDNGALTARSIDGYNAGTYAYNGLDKLTQADTQQGSVSYAYDALGRRVGRTEGQDARRIHLNGKGDLPDYWTTPSGGITAKLGRGPDGLMTFNLWPTTNSIPCYQLYSPHGDTTMITDTGGYDFFTATYDAFGNQLTNNGLWYGYLGKYQRYKDGVSNLVEMGVRDYDPGLGRFTSVDPLKGGVTHPQQRNRYQYVQNNPLVRYDLDGRFDIGIDLNPFNDDDENDNAENNDNGSNDNPDGAIPGVHGTASLGDGNHEDSQGQSVTDTLLNSTPAGQTVGAADDFWDNRIELKDFETKNPIPPENYDKYFHCKANYEASRRGNAGKLSAIFLSILREGEDQARGRKLQDSEDDLEADARGVIGENAGESLDSACGCYKKW